MKIFKKITRIERRTIIESIYLNYKTEIYTHVYYCLFSVVIFSRIVLTNQNKSLE